MLSLTILDGGNDLNFFLKSLAKLKWKKKMHGSPIDKTCNIDKQWHMKFS